eukprot:6632964-Pyramimonas_sp.AAC.1
MSPNELRARMSKSFERPLRTRRRDNPLQQMRRRRSATQEATCNESFARVRTPKFFQQPMVS